MPLDHYQQILLELEAVSGKMSKQEFASLLQGILFCKNAQAILSDIFQPLQMAAGQAQDLVAAEQGVSQRNELLKGKLLLIISKIGESLPQSFVDSLNAMLTRLPSTVERIPEEKKFYPGRSLTKFLQDAHVCNNRFRPSWSIMFAAATRHELGLISKHRFFSIFYERVLSDSQKILFRENPAFQLWSKWINFEKSFVEEGKRQAIENILLECEKRKIGRILSKVKIFNLLDKKGKEEFKKKSNYGGYLKLFKFIVEAALSEEQAKKIEIMVSHTKSMTWYELIILIYKSNEILLDDSQKAIMRASFPMVDWDKISESDVTDAPVGFNDLSSTTEGEKDSQLEQSPNSSAPASFEVNATSEARRECDNLDNIVSPSTFKVNSETGCDPIDEVNAVPSTVEGSLVSISATQGEVSFFTRSKRTFQALKTSSEQLDEAIITAEQRVVALRERLLVLKEETNVAAKRQKLDTRGAEAQQLATFSSDYEGETGQGSQMQHRSI